jgi:AcrR family transcriptional regulator
MGIAERRAREKEQLREKILDAASQLFTAEGIENVSIRKVADRIEYSPSTIYLYFKDKDELLATICQETFAQLSARLRKLVAQQSDPIQALRAGFRCYIEFGIQHPHHYHVTFSLPNKPQGIRTSAGAVAAADECFDILRQGLRAAMEAGRIRQTDLETVSLISWMFLHGVVSILSNCHDPNQMPAKPRLDVVSEAIEQLLRSLRPDSPGNNH